MCPGHFRDETNIGNPWPKLFGGFTNSFSYKGFDLSVLITGTSGNDIYNHIAKENNKASSIYISRNLAVTAMDYAKLGVDKDGAPIDYIFAGNEDKLNQYFNNKADAYSKLSKGIK